MRLDLNLARNPLRNDPAFYAGFWAAAALMLVLLLYNSCATVSYLRLTARARGEIERAERTALAYRSQSEQLRPRLETRLEPSLLREALLIRDLIDQRIFSWTLLFNQLERVVPDNVLLTAVQPKLERGVIQLALTGKARDSEAWRRLIDTLENSDAFRDAFPDNRLLKDGEIEFRLRVRYLPERAAAGAPGRSGGALPRSAG
ncbi:MAG TPA: PilN domain-containing protein [Acidobacteriota bacterium]